MTGPGGDASTALQRIGGERTLREEWQGRHPDGEPFPLDLVQAPVVPVTAATMWQPSTGDPVAVARAVIDGLKSADRAQLAAVYAVLADLAPPARARRRPRPQRATRTRQARRYLHREAAAGRPLLYDPDSPSSYRTPQAAICRRSGHTAAAHSRLEAER